MRQFAEQEIVLPSGPHEGRKFKIARQPFAGLLLDEMDSGRWRRIAVTGPAQSGKTLLTTVIPIMYHLFEVQETVIFGLPMMDMAADKWQRDILPAIQASRYREMLPKSGSGARGGDVGNSITFANGKTLRFMSAGGSDKSRSGYTTRVVIMTEVDGMDTARESSREADPVRQIEARTQAYGERARCYLECTVSLEEGRIWKEIHTGSNSSIEIRCPACKEYVTPERTHLIGWQGHENVMDAAANAAIVCPTCGGAWTEADRVEANRDCRIVHRNLRTDTLGFRWNAANNLLVPMGEVAKKEWVREREEDEAEEKALRQFVWAIPVEPDSIDLSVTDAAYVIARQDKNLKRGELPADTVRLGLGVDVQKRLCYWTCTALKADGGLHVVDYGVTDCPSDDLGEDRGIPAGIKDFIERVATPGWGGMKPTRGFVDCGNWQDLVVGTVKNYRPVFYPSKGFGEKQIPLKSNLEMTGWAAKKLETGEIIVELHADWWKNKLHDALQTPTTSPGAFTIFKVERPSMHQSFGKHLTAETKKEEFIAGKGVRTKWVAEDRRPNHWLDSTALSIAAIFSVRTQPVEQPVQASAAPVAPKYTTPDGRPFLVTQR